jgi:hypothetical protein
LKFEQKLEIVLDTIILALIAIKFVLNMCCSTRVSFGYQIFWVFLELIVVQILCTINWADWSLNIAAFLLCIGSSVTLYAKVLLFT